MTNQEQFIATIQQGYTFKSDAIIIGEAMLEGKTVTEAQVKIPLKTLNRHGLIAGATGTGKTKTIQVLSEKLAENGISVLMMDIKGDFSGIAEPGVTNPKIEERINLDVNNVNDLNNYNIDNDIKNESKSKAIKGLKIDLTKISNDSPDRFTAHPSQIICLIN